MAPLGVLGYTPPGWGLGNLTTYACPLRYKPLGIGLSAVDHATQAALSTVRLIATVRAMTPSPLHIPEAPLLPVIPNPPRKRRHRRINWEDVFGVLGWALTAGALAYRVIDYLRLSIPIETTAVEEGGQTVYVPVGAAVSAAAAF